MHARPSWWPKMHHALPPHARPCNGPMPTLTLHCKGFWIPSASRLTLFCLPPRRDTEDVLFPQISPLGPVFGLLRLIVG